MNSNKNHQGHIARKRFGQNFLIDHSVVDRIVKSINSTAADQIIEIGPGLGALTQELVNTGAKITLIELDRDLIVRLERTFASQIKSGRVTLINQDILKTNLGELILTDMPPVKIVGNLPYNISTPMMFHLLEWSHRFQSMTFMLQKEVVDRMCARPKTSHYSGLSVIMQLDCQLEKLFDVPPEAFNPAPKVESAVVQMQPRPDAQARVHDQLPAFRQFVHRCFQQRRKTLRNNLKDLMSAAAIEAIGINPQDRPEHLSLDDYVNLFHAHNRGT